MRYSISDILSRFLCPYNIKLLRTQNAWILIFLFIIVLVSGTASSSAFFDTTVLPKQLSAYSLTGVAALIYFICRSFSRDPLNISLNMPVLLFLLYLGVTLCRHGDIIGILNLLLSVVVYILCKEVADEEMLEQIFFMGVILCACHAIIVSLWQICKGYNVNGGYDTVSGFSLILALLFVYVMNYFRKNEYRIIQLVFLGIGAVLVFMLSSMRTAIIAVCCSFIFVVRLKLRIYVAIIGIMAIVILSISKIDSTYGRYNIYKTSLSMLDNPKDILFGRGSTGFRSSYMLYQAERLKGESKITRRLADNIKHPLNDFLLFAVNYGILLLLIGIILFITFICKNGQDFLAISLFITIVVYAFFTYPFHYPLTYIMCAFAFARSHNKISIASIRYRKYVAILFSLSGMIIGTMLMVMSIKLFTWNRDWKKAYINGMYGIISSSLTEYNRLAESMVVTNEFYYNWAYMLMLANKTESAVNVISKCEIVDYDTQMLKGDLSVSIDELNNALRYYREASEMCPNKLMPLYAQFRIYDKIGNGVEKYSVGHKILLMEEKVPSRITKDIKENVIKSMYY